jgi:transcriptional regulator with XRE-family HTH domain
VIERGQAKKYIRISGDTIRDIRESKYYSQRELAKKANLSHESICRIEREDRIRVFGRTVRGLAEALGVSPAEFIVEEKGYVR